MLNRLEVNYRLSVKEPVQEEGIFLGYDLETFCNVKYNNDNSFKKELDIEFSTDKYPKCKSISIKQLSKKSIEAISKYENRIVKIKRINIDRDSFEKILKEIKPTKLVMLWCNLTDDDINNVELNEDIEAFKLSYSSIKNMDKLFGDKNKKLVEVDISHNKLERLPIGLNSIDNLQELCINGNPNIFKNLNDEKSISYSVFKNVNKLYMRDVVDEYNIDEKKLCYILSLFPNVKDLDMSCNDLETMPLSLLKKVERLDISNNFKLKHIKFIQNDPAVSENNLRELDISKCESLVIDNTFIKHLQSIKYLNIMGVPLKENDYSEIYNLRKLKVLNILTCDKDKFVSSKFTSEVSIVSSILEYMKLVDEIEKK